LPKTDLVAFPAIGQAVQRILSRCLSPVLRTGRKDGRGGGGVGFVNPTGYDIVGMYILCFSFALGASCCLCEGIGWRDATGCRWG